jgi:biopolymer transport protein TolR
MRRKERKALIDLSLTPIIDVALTLLVIFIMTAPAISHAIRINLPRGSTKETQGQQQNDLTVLIDDKGNFFLNSKQVSPELLVSEIKTLVAHDTQKMVYIKADKALLYGTVVELVDEVKQIDGVSYVALATERRAKNVSSVA